MSGRGGAAAPRTMAPRVSLTLYHEVCVRGSAEAAHVHAYASFGPMGFGRAPRVRTELLKGLRAAMGQQKREGRRRARRILSIERWKERHLALPRPPAASALGQGR